MRGGAEGAAQVQKLRSELDHTGGSIKAVGEHSRTSAPLVGGFENSLRKAAGALVLTGAGFVAYQKAKQAVDWTVELTKKTDAFSKVTHMSTQESSTWVATAEALGVNASKLQMVFAKVSSEAIKQSESTGKSVTTFDRLGISTKEAHEHLNDFPGTMELVLKKLDDPRLNAVEKTALQTKLFGHSWSDLAPLLDAGAEGFKKYTDMAAKFGLSLGPDQQEKLQKLHEITVEEHFAVEGLRLKFTELIVGPLSGVIKGFNELAGAIIKGEWHKAEEIVDKAFQHIAKAGEKWLPKVADFVAEKVIPKVAEGFAKGGPKALEAFWTGFEKASTGGQEVIIGTLLLKFGPMFTGLGKTLGTDFGSTLMKWAVVAILGYEAFKHLKDPLLEALGLKKKEQKPIDEVVGQHGPHVSFTKEDLLRMSDAERKELGKLAAHDPRFSKHEREQIGLPKHVLEAQQRAATDHVKNAMKRVEKEYDEGEHGKTSSTDRFGPGWRSGHISGHPNAQPRRDWGNTGAWAQSAEARVPHTLPNDPGKYGTQPGSLRAIFDNRPIVIQINGREIARVNRREGLEAQAQGGE